MPTRYCGLGGNDAWDGLTWATRKLTLNGVENTPVVAGDVIYCAPGVYREMLTCDVSGGAGSPITYIADVSGENTDGVGGVVRVTGSDNDQTATRASCVTCAAQRNYRTFRGFAFDTTTNASINSGSGIAGTDWTIEDCTFQSVTPGFACISCVGANQLRWTVRRCKSWGLYSSYFVAFSHAAAVSNCGHVIENCIVINGHDPFSGNNINSIRVGGVTVRDCFIHGGFAGIGVATALALGQTVTVNNCIITSARYGVTATALGELVENYNNLYGNQAARNNVAVGANSVSYPPLLDLGIFHAGASQVSGFRFPPPLFGTLSQWSQVRAIADTGAATEDALGLTRPVTAGKRSWGAVQYVDMIRDTTNPRTGTACKELQDAGREQIRVPTVAVSMVFSVWVYRGANYAGVNPQMIIKQPGQADTVITDAGAAGVYNQLTTTLTPAALPGYVVIELVSNNTAAAGAYGVYFDDLTALEA